MMGNTSIPMTTLVPGLLIGIALVAVWTWGLSSDDTIEMAELSNQSSAVDAKKSATPQAEQEWSAVAARNFQGPLVVKETKPVSVSLPAPPDVQLAETFVSATFQQATLIYQGKTFFVQTGERIKLFRAVVESIQEDTITIKLDDGRSVSYQRKKKSPSNGRLVGGR